MAKDPAFLFYPGDWQGGTSTFSRFLKGCYMDILIAQFNSGHLSLDEIKTVLGSDFGTAWPALQKKFITDSKGLLFNEKLDNEITKRRLYSESRRKNREGNHTYVPSHLKHMIGHKENENENENSINGVSQKVPREPYSQEDYYESGQQMFEEIRDNELFLERLIRIVHSAGFISCKEILLLKAVKFFITRESAKPDFQYRPRDEHKKYLVNWITKNATTLNQYNGT